MTAYAMFFAIKVEHGLISSGLQKLGNELFMAEKCKLIMEVLSRCSIAKVMDLRGIPPVLDANELLSINLSGVATAVSSKKPIEFVHLTFAENLTAAHFLKMCFEPEQILDDDNDDDDVADTMAFQLDTEKLFSRHVSAQTLLFVDEGIKKYQGQPMDLSMQSNLKNIGEQVFKRICEVGTPALFNALLDKVFSSGQIVQWMTTVTDPMQNLCPFFKACRSNVQLASRLSKICPKKMQNDEVFRLVSNITNNCKNLDSLTLALSKVDAWQQIWPPSDFFSRNINFNAGSELFSPEQYEFIFNNIADLDESDLVEIIYSSDFSTSCDTELLPLLVRCGLDLTKEKDDLLSLNKFLIVGEGALRLLQFALQVAEHFLGTDDFDSVQSRLFRRNVGAKSPQELDADCSTLPGRAVYTHYMIERACLLFDGGECELNYSSAQDQAEQQYILGRCEWDERLKSIRTAYYIYLMRVCNVQCETDLLEIFLDIKSQLSGGFR